MMQTFSGRAAIAFRSSARSGTRAMAIVAALQIVSAETAFAQDEHLGITEYEIACLPCHGVDGRGDGPLASTLKDAPKDLTQIARENGGIFPAARVAAMIDGRADVQAHGMREMPVWGDRYRSHSEPSESAVAIDGRAQMQIDALVGYLEQIQER